VASRQDSPKSALKTCCSISYGISGCSKNQTLGVSPHENWCLHKCQVPFIWRGRVKIVTGSLLRSDNRICIRSNFLPSLLRCTTMRTPTGTSHLPDSHDTTTASSPPSPSPAERANHSRPLRRRTLGPAFVIACVALIVFAIVCAAFLLLIRTQTRPAAVPASPRRAPPPAVPPKTLSRPLHHFNPHARTAA